MYMVWVSNIMLVSLVQKITAPCINLHDLYPANVTPRIKMKWHQIDYFFIIFYTQSTITFDWVNEFQ